MTTEQGAPAAGAWKTVPVEPFTHPLQFHLDRVDAWLAELWAAKSIDVHDCSGLTRENQSGLLHDIREDVHRLRHEVSASPSPPPVGVTEIDDEIPFGEMVERQEPERDDAWWIKRIAEVAAELCRMGKPYDIARLRTFVPSEQHHILARLAAPPVGGEVVKLDAELVAFAKEIIRTMVFEASDIDGGDVQEIALKHGLLDREEYDPIRHGSHDSAEAGDDWFVFAGPLVDAPTLVPSSPSLLGPRFKIRQLGEIKCEGVDGEPEHINGLVLEALSDDDVRAAGSLFGQTVTVGVSP